MKNLKILLLCLVILPALLSACRDDMPELGSPIDKSSLSYSIEPNPNEPNMIILESLTPNVIPYWYTPDGLSTRVKDTVRIPFPGNYKFLYATQGEGGFVADDSLTLNITTTNLSYLSDPLWTYLSGGVGEEKSWVLDTDGVYFDGPITFFGSENGWLEGGEDGCYGDDCWSWPPSAEQAVNDDIVAAGDHGVMTFSLKNNSATFTATKPQEGDITETSSFRINVNAKTLSIPSASILRSYKPSKDGIRGVSNWNNYAIFSLTPDELRLGVLRDQDVDGEGIAYLVYNFIPKED
ncbi:hypothetical protein LVD15_14860 [Fulvivirga maritima]|uniref:hypothetical protein n=1 Tax=Fulvivirga maritima TaxID=2904247 RepID=UPI001F375909|nr:hypothetical protein [Fulvivirga maritima]UII24604.1 hypothetical protein LVD15_14860 [Fulvivirga maritima]